VLGFSSFSAAGEAGSGFDSFRSLVTEKDTLVAEGLFKHIRHPIYSGLLLDFVGLSLMRPTAPILAACALGWGFVFVQARLEEMDLCRRIPAYRDYMQRVPRFVPRVSFRPRPRVGRR